MPTKKSSTPSPRQKLLAAVHMVEADKDEVAFEKRLNKIAKARPRKRKPKQA